MKLKWTVCSLIVLLLASMALIGCSKGDDEDNPVVVLPDQLVNNWTLTERTRDQVNIPVENSEGISFYQDGTGRCAGPNSLLADYYFSNYFRWEKVSATELRIYNNAVQLLGEEILIGILDYSISGNQLIVTQTPIDGNPPTVFDNETTVWTK